MLVVITGGSGSGKSGYAEEVMLALGGKEKKSGVVITLLL